MKLLTIIGARPQFIKAAALSKAIDAHNKVHHMKIDEMILHTGQHYDENMSEVFFKELNIPKPKFHLKLEKATHATQTGQMLIEIEKILIENDFDLVLVYGDTNSTLAGALTAAKLNIPIIHIESGLRSHNMSMPEELNRIIVDKLSTYLFCSNEAAVEQLKNEGITENVFNCGDLMLDALLASQISKNTSKSSVPHALLTLHRQEITQTTEALIKVISTFESLTNEIKIVFPIHPRTIKILQSSGWKPEDSPLTCCEPMSYKLTIDTLQSASFLFTDSGGMQKEAYFLGVPCITLRNETEWQETVNTGWNILAGYEPDKITRAYNLMKNFNTRTERFPYYGMGNSGELIVNKLLELYEQNF